MSIDSVQATQQDSRHACVMIAWQDAAGTPQNAQFQFIDKTAATQADTAAATLKKWAAAPAENADPCGAACACS